MPLFFEIASYLQLPDLQAGVMEAFSTADDLFNVLQFKDISPAIQHQYSREQSLGQDAAWIASTGTVTEGAPTFSKVVDDVKILMGSVKIPRVNLSDPNIVSTMISQKAKTLARKFGYSAVSGQTSTGNEVQGLSSLVTGLASQSITADAGADGAALSLSALDNLVDLVYSGTRKPTFIISNANAVRKYKQLLRNDGGGVDSAMLQLANFGNPVLTFNGAPWLVSDWIPSSETFAAVSGPLSANNTSIYAVHSNVDDGYMGFYSGASVIDVIGPIEVTVADQVEFQVIMRVGLSLKSQLAAAVLRGVQTV